MPFNNTIRFHKIDPHIYTEMKNKNGPEQAWSKFNED